MEEYSSFTSSSSSYSPTITTTPTSNTMTNHSSSSATSTPTTTHGLGSTVTGSKRSWVWNHFQLAASGEYLVCKVPKEEGGQCLKQLNKDKSGSTKNMRNHLISIHKLTEPQRTTTTTTTTTTTHMSMTMNNNGQSSSSTGSTGNEGGGGGSPCSSSIPSTQTIHTNTLSSNLTNDHPENSRSSSRDIPFIPPSNLFHPSAKSTPLPSSASLPTTSSSCASSPSSSMTIQSPTPSSTTAPPLPHPSIQPSSSSTSSSLLTHPLTNTTTSTSAPSPSSSYPHASTTTTTTTTTTTSYRDQFTLKAGLAQMLKGGVIMDVTNVDQARIAEEAGAVAVMALERVPSDIRKSGGVARMSDPQMIKAIQSAVSIPVMAKVRIGHFVEAQILQALSVDYIDESEVLTPADPLHHIDKHALTTPFVCGCRNLGEALRRIHEGAAMIRTKGEAGTGNVVEAVRHARTLMKEIQYLQGLTQEEKSQYAQEVQAPLELVHETAHLGRLPVVNFAAGGIATPADAALMMQLGMDGVFVGSGIFKSSDPYHRAKAIVQAVTHYKDPHVLAQVSENLGEPMLGLDVTTLTMDQTYSLRGH